MTPVRKMPRSRRIAIRQGYVMALPGVTRKTNTVAVIVDHGGVQILSNGTTIFKGGGPDNNPFASIIDKFGEPLAQTEQIEDAAVKQSFQSALGEQIRHVMSVNTTALKASGSPNVLTCHQMEEKIIELQARAAQETNRSQRAILEGIIRSDMALLDAICHKGSQVP